MRPQPLILQRTFAALSFLLVASFYAFLYFLIPSFKELFREMGAPIPRHTQLVLDSYPYWFAFLIFAAVGFVLIWWRQQPQGWYLLLGAVLSVAIFLPLTVWAMYGPVVG